MTRMIEFRLRGHHSPDGELLGDDTVRLVGAVRALLYRLTRSAAERPGLGRAPAVIEQLSTVRVGLRSGSTVLVFRVGDSEALEVDPLADQVDASFSRLMDSMRRNVAPHDITPSVGAAAKLLLSALQHAASEVDVTVGHRAVVQLHTRSLDTRPWDVASAGVEEDVVVTGVLEAVDLRSHHFRVVDVAGNRIELIQVTEASQVAHLVGSRVTARGALETNRATRKGRMFSPEVAAAPHALPASMVPMPSLDELILQATNAPEAKPMDLSDEELVDFLAAARG